MADNSPRVILRGAFLSSARRPDNVYRGRLVVLSNSDSLFSIYRPNQTIAPSKQY